MRNEHLLRLIRTIPDVPKPGIMFRDITPLLASPEGFAATVQELVAVSEELRPTKVIGVEASVRDAPRCSWPTGQGAHRGRRIGNRWHGCCDYSFGGDLRGNSCGLGVLD